MSIIKEESKKIMTVAVSCAALALPSLGGTTAWYQFGEAAPGVPATGETVIVDSANGHDGVARQMVDATPTTSGDNMPRYVSAFPSEVSVFDPISKTAHVNTGALLFKPERSGNKGNGSVVLLPHDAAFESQDLTVEFFMKGEPETPDAYQYLIGQPNNDTRDRFAWTIVADKDPSRDMLIWMTNDENGNAVDTLYFNIGKKALRDGQWHHVAMTLRASDRYLSCYFDYRAVPLAESYMSRTLKNSLAYRGEQGIFVGACSGKAWGRWNGCLDEVRISNSALAPAQFLRFRGAVSPMPSVQDLDVYVSFGGKTNWFPTADGQVYNEVPGQGKPFVYLDRREDGREPVLSPLDKPEAWMYSGRDKRDGLVDFAAMYFGIGSVQRSSSTILIDDIVNDRHSLYEGSFTLEFFLKPDGVPVGDKTYLFMQHMTGGGFWCELQANGAAVLTVSDGTSHSMVCGEGVLCDGNWHHVAMVVNREEKWVDFFVDRKRINREANFQLPNTLAANYTSCLQISGGYYGAATPYQLKGWLDDLRIVRRALTEDEFLRAGKEKQRMVLIVR